jgi:hypothetical protein
MTNKYIFFSLLVLTTANNVIELRTGSMICSSPPPGNMTEDSDFVTSLSGSFTGTRFIGLPRFAARCGSYCTKMSCITLEIKSQGCSLHRDPCSGSLNNYYVVIDAEQGIIFVYGDDPTCSVISYSYKADCSACNGYDIGNTCWKYFYDCPVINLWIVVGIACGIIVLMIATVLYQESQKKKKRQEEAERSPFFREAFNSDHIYPVITSSQHTGYQSTSTSIV